MSAPSSGIKAQTPKEVYSNARLRSFLDALDEADNVTATDWECGFISNTMDIRLFTDKQKVVIESMISRYGHRMRGEW